MTVTLLADGGRWSVWIALDVGDPLTQQESFAIGTGETQAAAFASAQRALEQAIDDLVVLAHDQGIEVRR